MRCRWCSTPNRCPTGSRSSPPAGDTPGPAAAPAAHNREKQRWLSLERPFLAELGVTTAEHQLVPAMARKWKQINKFVEVFAHALEDSPLKDA